MKRLFPIPLYSFIKIALKNGGISLKGVKLLPQWLLKTVLFEPIRWVELIFTQKIIRHKITKDPIFILGFYRSGTSFIHQFLTQDFRLAYHTNFQMIFPEIMLSSERVLSPCLEFFCRIFNIQDPVHRVRLSFKYPGEEDAAMTTSLNPRGAQWGYFFPKMMLRQFRKYVLFENIPNSEIEEWTKDYLFLLKKISLANKGKQLVLKSPPNTARIKLILSMFPNAKFILMHRNPYDVFSSNQKFWKLTNKIYAIGKTEPENINEIILETYSKIMGRYLEEKALIPEKNIIEIAYDDLIQNPMSSMRTIYNTLDLDDFNFIESKMANYINDQKSFVPLKHKLKINEQREVTNRWGPFILNWDYPLL